MNSMKSVARKFSVLIAAVALLSPALAHSADGYDIIVVGGQSNSSNGGLGPRTDPLRGFADTRIFHLGCIDTNNNSILDGNDASGVVALTEYTQDCQSGQSRELHLIKTYDKIGFAVSFARQYTANRLAPGRKTLIVAGGAGGTGQKAWAPGQPLLENLLSRTRAALALPGENRVVAVLWSQGEADIHWSSTRLSEGLDSPTTVDQDIQRYAYRMQAIIVHMRTALKTPTLPFLVGPKPPQWTKYQAMKLRYLEAEQWAVRSVGRSGFVADWGLTSNRLCNPGEYAGTVCDPDYVHFSAQAQIYIGIRFFHLFNELMPRL